MTPDELGTWLAGGLLRGEGAYLSICGLRPEVTPASVRRSLERLAADIVRIVEEEGETVDVGVTLAWLERERRRLAAERSALLEEERWEDRYIFGLE